MAAGPGGASGGGGAPSEEGSTAPAVAAAPPQTFGCGKCRWAAGGCGRCRAADFVPGPKEGRAGGIPQPGREGSLRVVGEAGDSGGVRVPVAVTDDTPICNRLRDAGLPPGLGLVASDPISAGTHVIEYVGEVLTRDQAEEREAVYAARGLHCSYPLFTELHGFVIDATLYGNAARFINGSCDPNLKQAPMRHHEMSVPRVIFTARRDIAAGEELTWQYGAESAATAAAAAKPNAYDVARQPFSSSSNRRGGSSHANLASRDSSVAIFQQGGVRCFCGSRKCKGVL